MLRGYVTPRRLTVIADGIPERQPDRSEERRGPRVGAPPQAIDGFLRAAGARLDRAMRGARHRPRRILFRGRSSARAARPPRCCPSCCTPRSSSCPGRNRCASRPRRCAGCGRWSRSICLFDGEVLPLPLDQVPVGRTTRGHRFLSEGEITVDNAADYLEKLEAAHVVLDQDRRRDMIAADLDRLAAAEGLTVKPDPGLLDEVTGLVEYPVVLIGSIDAASMELPPEVLATAMRTHQKYFSCLQAGRQAGAALPVRRQQPDAGRRQDDRRRQRAGAARPPRRRPLLLGPGPQGAARLAGRGAVASASITQSSAACCDKVAADGDGSAEFLVAHVPGADAERARRAALLAKADLSTGMVGEFPELQGVMGRYYALHDGEDPRVADAIADTTSRRGRTIPARRRRSASSSRSPTSSTRWSLSSRSARSRPDRAIRSRLRRAALGIIRIILENRLRLPLRAAFRAAHRIAGARSRTIGIPGSSVIGRAAPVCCRSSPTG